MTPELGRSFIRTSLAMRAQARREGVSPDLAWHVVETLVNPAMEKHMRDDYDRENWAAFRTRLRKVIFGEYAEGIQGEDARS